MSGDFSSAVYGGYLDGYPMPGSFKIGVEPKRLPLRFLGSDLRITSKYPMESELADLLLGSNLTGSISVAKSMKPST